MVSRYGCRTNCTRSALDYMPLGVSVFFSQASPRVESLGEDAHELVVFPIAFDLSFDGNRATRFQVAETFEGGRNDGTRLVHQLNTNG